MEAMLLDTAVEAIYISEKTLNYFWSWRHFTPCLYP